MEARDPSKTSEKAYKLCCNGFARCALDMRKPLILSFKELATAQLIAIRTGEKGKSTLFLQSLSVPLLP
ncbi:hypothetical protein J2S74_004550 [Evansella vedderi]|uniref:Uncharacterized protein n=1 Tax=Evansella vedderi TaxID=38282 RepID=A0ABU0A0V1_9BACI|nr:hypothetical protein [Evansella vedderi]MDQ0257104.1 hypothetical protein [Evansella vedderi]